MTYFEFIEHYCRVNKLTIGRLPSGKRLHGHYLTEIKLLSYILRVNFDMKYRTVATVLQLFDHKSAMIFYYSILGDSRLRNQAEERYREIVNVRHIQENGSGKKDSV